MAYGTYENMPVAKKRKKKSPWGKHHRSNCYRKDLLVDVEISGQKFEEKQDLQSLSASPQRYFLTTKWKIVTLLWRNWQKPLYPSDPGWCPRSKACWHHTPSDMMCGGERSITQHDFCPEYTTLVKGHETSGELKDSQ